MKRSKVAFTLIELLIVVAIIAILAAIAVPNFLEAQTRAKVARVKSDHRTIATAAESYSVDWNDYPLGWRATARGEIACPTSTPNRKPINIMFAYSLITTPIAYLTSVPKDPFTKLGVNIAAPDYKGLPPIYDTFGMDQWKIGNDYGEAVNKYGYVWLIWSFGPGRAPYGPNIQYILLGYHQANRASYFCPYDPTNGTVSFGYIMRSNKGVFPD
jgi:prepilin-type N-terminal cleavage/methylation domain-containing protein